MFKVGEFTKVGKRAAEHLPDAHLVGKVCRVIAVGRRGTDQRCPVIDVEFDDGTTNYFFYYKLDKVIKNMKEKRELGLAK